MLSLRADVERLQTALHEYGQHHDYCTYYKTDGIDQCDCGYNNAWGPSDLDDTRQTTQVR